MWLQTKRGSISPMEPRSIYNRYLAIVDVHRDFEAETKIFVGWFFPLHYLRTSCFKR